MSDTRATVVAAVEAAAARVVPVVGAAVWAEVGSVATHNKISRNAVIFVAVVLLIALAVWFY